MVPRKPKPVVAPLPVAAAKKPNPVVDPGFKPISTALQALELKMQFAQKQPPEHQPIDELLADYYKLSVQPGLSPADYRITIARIKQLNRLTLLADALNKVASVRQEISNPPPAQRDDPKALTRQQYDRVGQLRASGLYNGRRLPRLYRLVDPNTKRTITYLLPNPSVDLAACLGKYVGIVGHTKYDPKIKLDIFHIKHLDTLDKS